MTEILICGCTELFTEDALLRLAEEYRVVIAGPSAVSGNQKHITAYKTSPTEEKFRQLFDVYSFQTIYYVSGYTDGGNGLFGETQQLEQVMLECSRSRVDKLVVFSTVDSQNYMASYGKQGELLKKDYYSSRCFGAGQMEEMCQYFMERSKMPTVMIRLPYLADRINDKNFLGHIFRSMYEEEKVMLPYHREDPLNFLTLDDLVELMFQLTEETEDDSGIYYAVSGYHYTYGDLEDMLKIAVPDAKIVYENYPFVAEIPSYPKELRRKYGFIPMDNAMENIGTYYRTFVNEVMTQKSGLAGKIMSLFARAGKGALKYVELVLVFIIAEIISHYTSESIYFKFVDVRLFYIIIMGTIYGMRTGLVAAVLECLVLIREYALMGMNGTILFYNIENWIPFVVYLMAGSITGYISNKKDDALAFVRREYSLLRDKYLFLSDVYHGAVENKGEYKKQILGFKDSFGKIFDAVQKLDSEYPERIFFEGVKVLEDILENHTIAIYTLDSWQKFGRLAVCSNSLLTKLTKSIRIEDYSQLYDTVKKGQVWKDTDMVPGIPMYACGIFKEGTMVLLITIQEADVEQYGMHYMNIFQIMCGLVQTSFLRALEYEELAESKMYDPRTHIAYPERLRQLLEVQESMKEAGVADHVLIRFKDKDKERVSDQLSGMIRASDVLGTDEDGNIYLLLVQMNRENFRIVGDRLNGKGMKYQIVEAVG